MQYVIAIIVIAICTLIVWKSAYLGQNVPIRWAEEHLHGAGQAGSVTFYRLVGVLVILGALLWITGGLQALIIMIFGRVGA